MMPPLVSKFADELGSRYAMHPLVPVAAILATVGAAAGRRFKIDTGLGADPVSANHFLALVDHPGSRLEHVLSHILKPMREHARASLLHRQAGRTDNGPEIARILQDRSRFFRGERHPDPSHAKHFDDLLKAQSAASHPLFLLDSAGPGRLSAATDKFPAGNIFAIYDSPAVATLLEKIDTRAGRFDVEMMARGWDGKSFEGLFLEGAGDSVIQNPSVSLLLHAGPLELGGLLTHPVMTKAGLSGQILLLDPGAPSQLTKNVFTELTCEKGWADLINDLLGGPADSGPVVIQASVHARAVGYRFSNQVLVWMKGVPEEDRPFLPAWPEIVWRLMLALHLCSDDPLAPVSKSTAEAAVALVQSLGERQLAFFREYRAVNDQQARASAADIMAAKIAETGRISPRDLFRKYNDQRREVHDPVIALLLQEGRIREDTEGCFVAVKAAHVVEVQMAPGTEPVAGPPVRSTTAV